MTGSSLYEIRWKLRVEGVVERQDVIGALYSETKRLEEKFDLDRLEERGRITGVDIIDLSSQDGVTNGVIRTRCNFGSERAAELAAALETVEVVGPCDAYLETETIRRYRNGREEFIDSRARELQKELEDGEGVSS